MKKSSSILFIFISALLYGLSIPLSKLLMKEIPSTLLSGILYLGAGIGVLIIYLFRKHIVKNDQEKSLDKHDLKYLLLMIILDIIAPILLLLAVSKSSASSISLLSNFEIVATALIALLIFKEPIGKYLWIGIIILTIAVILLSLDFNSGFSFSWYSLLVIGATTCYGLENNCTKKMSDKNPYQITMIKGLFSGSGALIIGLIIGERTSSIIYIILALILGFLAYGLSVFLYIRSERYLGAAKTSSYFSIAPFFGFILSFIIFKETPYFTFYIALALMIIGITFVIIDKNKPKSPILI